MELREGVVGSADDMNGIWKDWFLSGEDSVGREGEDKSTFWLESPISMESSRLSGRGVGVSGLEIPKLKFLVGKTKLSLKEGASDVPKVVSAGN